MTTKQIYGIFGITTILFLIIGFLVAQNIQNYGKISTANSNLTNNFSQNSSNNLANSNSQGSLSPNSQNSQSENLSNSQNSSNKTGEINQNSSQIQNNDLTIPGATEKHYFNGSVNKKPIRMVLNYSCTSTPICHEQTIKGNYIYENISTDKLQLNCTFLGAGIAKFECQESEISDSNNLGQTSKTTGTWSGETAPSNMDKISGAWTNPNKTTTLPFSLEQVEKFNLEDYLVKNLVKNESLAYLKKDKVSIEDRKLWYQKLKWSEKCEDRFSWRSDENESGVKFLNLSDTEFLVEISCGYGAYQRWSNFVYYDENNISKLLEFDSYDEKSSKIKINILTSAGFNSKTKTLKTWNKYVGHGVCGYAGDYEWNNDLKSFELTDFKQNTDCDNPVGEDKWKVIYRK